jgi:hypothetical protein
MWLGWAYLAKTALKNKKEGKVPPLLIEQHEVPVETRGLCEMGFERRETPSRIGGDTRPTGAPIFWRP